MNAKRIGCFFCFQTLDPKDPQINRREFVKCSGCGNFYHESCWNTNLECLSCGSKEAHPIDISRPPALKAVTRKQALSIKPSTVIHLQKGHVEKKDRNNTWKNWIIYFGQLTQASLVGLILISFASFICAFAYRLLNLELITVESLMNAVFKQPLPRTLNFIGTSFTGSICALIFYAPLHPKISDESSHYLLRIITGIVVVAILDTILFGITPHDLMEYNFEPLLYEDVLYAQASVACVMLLFTPLHKRVSPIKPPPQLDIPPKIAEVYGLIRTFLVTLLLIIFIIYFSAYRLPPSLNWPKFEEVPLISGVTIPTIGALLMSLALAAMFYWPPRFREVKWKFSIFRLLIVILSLVGIGLMYRETPNTVGFADALTVSATTTFAALPVQRVLSLLGPAAGRTRASSS